MSKEKKNFNGEGTLYFSESLNRWVGQFTDPNTGKRKSIYDTNEKKARKKLRDAIKAAEDGIYVNKTNVTVYQIGKDIVELKFKTKITKEAAYLRNLETLKTINDYGLGSTKVQKVTTEKIQDFFNNQTHRANSCIDKIHSLLNQIFKKAIKKKIITENPLEDIIKPKSEKQDKKVEALTLEEHQHFIKALENEKYKNIFLLEINTGMRPGEILALTPNDIDFKNNCIHITKTLTKDIEDNYKLGDSTKTYAGTRDFPLDDQLKAILKDSISKMKLNKNQLIFTLENCKIINVSTINTVFKRICRNLKFNDKDDYNQYMLRHTFATRCIEAGMPAHVLQKLLGHADVSTTINTYLTIFNKYKEEELKKVADYKVKMNLV